MEENEDTISQASRLEFGQRDRHALGHVCEARHLAVNIAGIRRSILYESRNERARHAEKEAEEHKYVDTDY